MTTLAPNDFTHLHVHSEFSLLDGLGRIGDLVDEAERLGFDSLALTDHGALYGAVAFYQAAVGEGDQADHRRGDVRRPPVHARQGGQGRRPALPPRPPREGPGRLPEPLPARHRRPPRWLLLQAADRPRAPRPPRRGADRDVGLPGRRDPARPSRPTTGSSPAAWPASTATSSGKGSFFLELQDHGLPEQRRLNEQLLRLAPETGLPLVVTNDLHYVHRAQSEAHDVLLCVGTGSNLDTPGRLKFETSEFYLKSAAEMAALFPDQREAILNTRRIAEMVDLRAAARPAPDPALPGARRARPPRAGCGRSASAASPGATGRSTPELQARLDYELGVITSMGYAGYFLIVADFVRFAREQGIQTTCRGSAPGSIVTYTLGITPVDPIHYQLPFERFLNPDRVTMPDIDVDFEDGRRDEVIAYVTRKYGADHVAQIITFGTMLARAAIRDVGRVLGHGYGDVDRIAKAVPNQLGIRLDEALEISPQLHEMDEGDPSVRRIIDFARQLEGVARNASTHAAGVVISREPLTELMPLQQATNSDAAMTQYEMHGIEALGLLKFDFLGLSNLTILRQAVDLVRAHRGVEIDLDRIPLDDATTFELLASGETTGVFQLESAGMRRYIRELRPTSVYDLAAMVALYRPGPMDNIPPVHPAQARPGAR